MNSTLLYVSMAQYNRWMNEKLLEVGASFSDEDRKKSRSVPFNSLHGLWNHLLLTNRLWLARFENTPLSYQSLHEEICSDYEELRREFAVTDAQIEAFAKSINDDQMDRRLKFTRISDGGSFDLPYWIAVQQIFNHQTHHRGQITALIEQMGGDCGVTDFPLLPTIQGL